MSEWRLPGFTELNELGSGAQGRVVLARHEESGEIVAIKYLAADRLTDERALEQFRGEARTLVQVASPHIARLRGLVETPGGAAIVMEAVNGVALRTLLDRYLGMSPESALVVLKGSLQGLAAAHAAGVIHRDYKPANVVVQADGLSKLIDFGIAGLAGSHSGAGTPAYMAPEQWEGGPASPATDVYAAACVFFECVAGRRPYAGGDRMALMRRHLMEPVPVAAAPEPVRPLLVRGMAKDPAQRPPGAAAFVTELEAVAGAAYGPGWEARGWAALGMATAAVAMLFPLAALSAAAGGGAAAGVSAGQAGVQTAAGKGLLATTGAKVAAAAAATTVVATAGTGTYVVVAGEEKPPPARQVQQAGLNTRVLDFTTALPGGRPALQVQKAQYVQVSGLSDKVLEKKVNAALRAPLDEGIARFRTYVTGGHPQPDLIPRCARVTGQASVRLNVRSLASVRYTVDTTSCTVADEDPPERRSVTVSLRTGEVLRPADVFTPGTLTGPGLRTLSARLPRPTPRTRECGFNPPLTRAQLEPDQALGVAATQLTFTPSTLEFFFQSGLPCPQGAVLTLPYDRVRDLLKPELLAMIR